MGVHTGGFHCKPCIGYFVAQTKEIGTGLESQLGIIESPDPGIAYVVTEAFLGAPIQCHGELAGIHRRMPRCGHVIKGLRPGPCQVVILDNANQAVPAIDVIICIVRADSARYDSSRIGILVNNFPFHAHDAKVFRRNAQSAISRLEGSRRRVHIQHTQVPFSCAADYSCTPVNRHTTLVR